MHSKSTTHHYDITLDSTQDLESILSHEINDQETSDFTISALTGGITNKLYKLQFANMTLLCRVNGIGTENLLDREKETRNMRLLSEHGVGSTVHFTFNNGFVYNFIPGRCLAHEEMPVHAHIIAKKMAEFHTIPTATEEEPNVFKMCKKWFRDIKSFSYDEYDEQTQQKIANMRLEEMEKELYYLESLAQKYNCDIVFCHNDLLPYNIIYDHEANLVSFIDYEYCGTNYRGFEIGNHWLEHSGFTIDPAFYPSVDQQRHFIRHYLKGSSSFEEVTEELVEQLRVEANFFSLWANLAWGTWSVPQFKFSNIEFDYLDYGQKKFDWFWMTRDQYVNELVEFYENKQQQQY